MTSRKKNLRKVEKGDKEEEEELKEIRMEIEEAMKGKGDIEASTKELEKRVAMMEMNVFELESGNFEADDSEVKQRYDNQKQLNIQLNEQKRWLEHELEEIKQKIQNDKQSFLPDPFMMDWDNLSENELKRLVAQLEKTRSDVKMDLREAQLLLDHEGKEFHHYDYFCQLYRAEILSLNRTLDSLMRSGLLPTSYHITSMYSLPTSINGSFPSTGLHTPNMLSPKKTPSSPRKSAPGSPRKTGNIHYQKSKSAGNNTELQKSPKRKQKMADSEDSKIKGRLGPLRKTGMIRNLPKIDRKSGLDVSTSESNSLKEPDSKATFLNGMPLTPISRRGLDIQELDPVQEVPTENLEESD